MSKSKGKDVIYFTRTPCWVEGINNNITVNNNGTLNYAGEDIGYQLRSNLSHDFI